MPPTLTARVAPVGIKLDDGQSSKIAFAADPDISLWEKTVQPPGIDGGDPVDTTTMHNSIWRTQGARKLKTLMESTFSCAYDPSVLDQIKNIINVETSITIHFPDLSTYTFFGYLQKFEPEEMEEGEMPMATGTVVPTNQDPTTGAESGPVLVSVAGT